MQVSEQLEAALAKAYQAFEDGAPIVSIVTLRDAIPEIKAMEARLERANALLDGIDHEIKRTTAWRSATGMRPAGDNSDFAGAPLSSLQRLRWWSRELRAALAGQPSEGETND